MKPSYEELERYGRQADITIENLEMKLAQMAAENSGLRHLLDKVSETGNANFGRTSLQTPATDAILAEVRAQGVEKLSSLAGNECQRYKSVGDRAGVRKWKSIVILCTDFAAHLRQEAK